MAAEDGHKGYTGEGAIEQDGEDNADRAGASCQESVDQDKCEEAVSPGAADSWEAAYGRDDPDAF